MVPTTKLVVALLPMLACGELSYIPVQAKAHASLKRGEGAVGLIDVNALPLSEAGYQKVAALKSDEMMQQYMWRILKVHRRQALDLGQFAGLAPYYSGTKDVQTHARLAEELLSMPWAVPVAQAKHVDPTTGFVAVSQPFQQDTDGSVAPLSEDGYRMVAALKNDAAMATFTKRLLASDGLTVRDEGMLNGLVPFFSGTTDVQSLKRLTEQLSKASWVHRPL